MLHEEHLKDYRPNNAMPWTILVGGQPMALSAVHRSKLFRQRHPEKVTATKRESERRFRERCPAAVKERSAKKWAKYAANNREKINAKAREAMAKLRLEQPERVSLWKEAYMERLAGRSRSSNCEACGSPFEDKPRKRGHFDHDHVTGKFRGWLCRECNITLGLVKDSVEKLQALIAYLGGNRVNRK